MGFSFVLSLMTFCFALAQPREAKKSALYEVELKTIEGKSTTLSNYQGQVLLIVNTASECGYTPQYEGLEKLYQQYQKQGLMVLGFPSNDFGGQEPGSNAEIKKFCQLKYKVSFPMFEKGAVSGKSKQPLYSFLLKEGELTDPKWNFEKILISRQGKVLNRFRSGTQPMSDELKAAIEKALANRQ